ncbi:MAG: RNA pseudouridine synthase, partial [Nitrospinae bacterium RIFCSPLOWO2_12_FULL_47_7]
VFLSETQTELSRSYLQKLIDDGQVTVNGSHVRAKHRLKVGDHVALNVPDPTPLETAPENLPLHILYEDDWILIIDKPAGMVVHPAPGHGSGTLVNALLYHCSGLTGIGGVERPGIVHRLDKETSGLVVVAKTDAAMQSLAHQFKERLIRKEYLALVKGKMERLSGVIDTPIGRHKIHRKKMSIDMQKGRDALTRYEVIASFENYSYVRLFPKTGRTHQIRVHLASIGYPILGDKQYGGKSVQGLPEISRQALHAHKLELLHPHTAKPLVFESPLPPDMASLLPATA